MEQHYREARCRVEAYCNRLSTEMTTSDDALPTGEDQLTQLRAQMVHLARLHDLGEVAGGIAHNINQPLTAIVNYLSACQLILDEPVNDQNLAELRTLIMRAAEQALRAGTTVRRLRDFISVPHEQRRRHRLADLVEGAMALGLLDAGFKGISVELELEAGDCQLDVDQAQIQHMLINVMRNAVDALEDLPAGTPRSLLISARRLEQDRVELSVIDNGQGVVPDLRQTLFEPFVTSKKHALGTGLSVARRLAEAHGGTIEADYSVEGRTIIRFTLPLADDRH